MTSFPLSFCYTCPSQYLQKEDKLESTTKSLHTRYYWKIVVVQFLYGSMVSSSTSHLTDIKFDVNELCMSNNNIPSSEESQETRNKQEFVEGQSKDVNIAGYPEVTSLAQALKNLGFPASKNQIVTFVQSQQPNSEILSRLTDIEDKLYSNVSEVAKETHLVS